MTEPPESLQDVLLAPFRHFTDPSDRMSYVYMGTALLIAITVYIVSHAREGTLRPAGLVRWLFPRDVLFHPSCQTDFAYFFVIRLIRAAIYGSILVSSGVIAVMTQNGLIAVFGPPPEGVEPRLWLTILTTLIIVIVTDATLWFMHYIYHVVPFLWDYHKVHHSAEVMTPITAARMHPVEEMSDATVAGLTIGSTYGVLGYLLGDGAQELTIFEVNIVVGLFFLAAFNLRHSHVWVRYPTWLQHILICPAQHQIHHSTARQHWDKNMGFIFSVWDWAAGTLYAPKGREEITFGLGTEEDGGAWHSVRALLFRPFGQSWERIRQLTGQRRPG
jgi:sterol desaturase/sphingolipid hydroxylase (fatty acid hydroxylase superfamily)